MRTTRRLLSLTIGWVMLAVGTSYATEAQQTSPESTAKTVSDHRQDPEHVIRADGGKRQENGKPSMEGRDRSRRSGKNHLNTSVALPKVPPKRVSNNRQGSPSGNATDHHQPGSDKRGDVTKSGSNRGNIVHSSQHVRRAESIRSTAPSVNNVRHPGANPAIIGGSAKPVARNTGAIDGTTVHRRP